MANSVKWSPFHWFFEKHCCMETLFGYYVHVSTVRCACIHVHSLLCVYMCILSWVPLHFVPQYTLLSHMLDSIAVVLWSWTLMASGVCFPAHSLKALRYARLLPLSSLRTLHCVSRPVQCCACTVYSVCAYCACACNVCACNACSMCVCAYIMYMYMYVGIHVTVLYVHVCTCMYMYVQVCAGMCVCMCKMCMHECVW